jgi:hypothetical protein
MMTPVYAEKPENNATAIRDYFRGLSQIPLRFSSAYTRTKYPLDESIFPSKNIEAQLSGPGVGTQTAKQFIQDLRSSDESDITLDVWQGRFLSHEARYSFSVDKNTRGQRVQDETTAFDGDSSQYYYPDERQGTISSKNSASCPENPLSLYLKAAAIVGDSTRYILDNTAVCGSANATSTPQGDVITVKDTAPDNSSTVYQFVVNQVQGRILECRKYSVMSDARTELQAKTTFENFTAFATADKASLSVPGNVEVCEEPFSGPGGMSWGNRRRYAVKSFGISPDSVEHYRCSFPIGTVVWRQDIDISYTVGANNAKIPSEPPISIEPLEKYLTDKDTHVKSSSTATVAMPAASATASLDTPTANNAQSASSQSKSNPYFVVIIAALLAVAIILMLTRRRLCRQHRKEEAPIEKST